MDRLRIDRDTRGNVAIMLALSLLPLLIFAGFAVDLNRQQRHERNTTAALDAAALAVARHAQETGGSTAELKAIAQANFDVNYRRNDEISLAPLTFAHDLENHEITVSVTGDMPTSMIGIIGIEDMGVSASSSAVYGRPQAFEVVLVVDMSNSMSGPNIMALRDAAKTLIDETITEDSPDTRIGIVPFNNWVNVGTEHRNAAWMSVDPDHTATYDSCPIDWTASRALGCTSTRVCGGEGQFGGGDEACRDENTCPPGVDLVRQTCVEVESERVWLGCVESRDAPLNRTDADYDTDPIIGELDPPTASCLADNKIVPLTRNKSTLRNALNDFDPVWDTYIPTGLIWGLRTLSPGEPFDGARLPVAKQAIVLMSDGANTRSLQSNGEHWGTDVEAANTLTADVCQEIKDLGIALYTVDYGIDDTETEALLRNCATSADHNFEADNTNELRTAFLTIAADFQSIALSR